MFPKTFLRAVSGLAILILLGTAQEATGTWLTDFTAALQAAKVGNKRVIVDFSAPWCGWCSKMRTDVFDQETFKTYVEDKFILLELNADHHRDLVEKFTIEGYPTLLILDAEGKEIRRIVGFRPLVDVMTVLQGLPQK